MKDVFNGTTSGWRLRKIYYSLAGYKVGSNIFEFPPKHNPERWQNLELRSPTIVYQSRDTTTPNE